MQATTFPCPLYSTRCTTSDIAVYSAIKRFHAYCFLRVQYAASDKEYWRPIRAAIQETSSYVDLLTLQSEKGQM